MSSRTLTLPSIEPFISLLFFIAQNRDLTIQVFPLQYCHLELTHCLPKPLPFSFLVADTLNLYRVETHSIISCIGVVNNLLSANPRSPTPSCLLCRWSDSLQRAHVRWSHLCFSNDRCLEAWSPLAIVICKLDMSGIWFPYWCAWFKKKSRWRYLNYMATIIPIKFLYYCEVQTWTKHMHKSPKKQIIGMK